MIINAIRLNQTTKNNTSFKGIFFRKNKTSEWENINGENTFVHTTHHIYFPFQDETNKQAKSTVANFLKANPDFEGIDIYRTRCIIGGKLPCTEKQFKNDITNDQAEAIYRAKENSSAVLSRDGQISSVWMDV